MNIPAGKQPATWQDYEQGRHSGSPGSVGSRVQWSEDLGDDSNLVSRTSSVGHGHPGMRRRRSSINMRLNALRQIGGVNSIDNFAASWQRAANFHEIAPVRPSFRFEDDGDSIFPTEDLERTPSGGRSLIRAGLEEASRRASDHAVDDDTDCQQATEETPLRRPSTRIPGSWTDSLFSVEPSFASVLGGSYGTMYASQTTRPRAPSIRHAAMIFNEEQLKKVSDAEMEQEPLIIKQIEEEGVKYHVVVGQSTLPQTVFNSVNVLIGVGLLSLPLGLRYAGWIIGVVFFTCAVLVTRYTAKLLAKCLDVDNSLVTFADLAYVSFGHRARLATSLLFTIELVAACVALVILFADSLDALIPGLNILTWKLICCVVLIPLGFMPLNLLSFTSVLGILCCLGIVCSVFVDGLIKPHQPGSLLEPATTYFFPEHWQTIPLSFGLLMSPWGGHSVFPNIYRDMRHPYKYHRAVDITYGFTFVLDIGMAVIGLLMFGDGVRDEITSNILLTDGYPRGLSVFIVICIAIIPLTKVPLNARPIVTTIEVLVGLLDTNGEEPSFANKLARALIRVATTIVFVAIAIVFPSFDRIMTLLGAVCCFSICIVLPVAFHLRLFGKELSTTEKAVNWVLLVTCTIMAIVSTVFACLPRDMLNGKL